MRLSDFRFDLPEQLIADRPVEPRDQARLLVYERSTDECRHLRVCDLPGLLASGDLLVLNDTRVLPWRLTGRRATGGGVEVLILARDIRQQEDVAVEGSGAGELCRGFLKPAKKARPGSVWRLEDRIDLEVVAPAEQGGGQFYFRLTDSEGVGVDAAIDAVGRAPLPPYIEANADRVALRERYQTVFAEHDGAVAAPTAGLHFTPELFSKLEAGGVERAQVTLHVGEGTFAPVRVDTVEEHEMHSERFELGEAVVDAVARTRAGGGRVVAVGTTSTRTLESCAVDDRQVRAAKGETNLFLYPGRSMQVVDALMTNFHLPESTLLMLVSAMIGRERLLEIYADAIKRRYRFYSFGDAMLIL